MIELLKMIKGIYDPMCIPCVEFRELSVDLIRTRGNRYKLIQHHCHYDLRKFNFTNRLSPYGTVYLIMLSLLKQLTLLRTG